MRDSINISSYNSREIQPLIPDPPIKRPRVKQRSHFCHSCWSKFTCCSKWLCILITILVIVLILIIVRSVLPFGWPWWFPSISYDPSDPHIIFIVTDDLGWSDVSYGGAEFPTTAIDSLRQNGIALDRMYVHESGAASRAAYLTGIPGYSLGLTNGISTGSDAHLPLDVSTLPELLKNERGYATHMVGKWGLGYSKWDYTPTSRGFDTFIGFHQRYIDYWHYSATIESNSHTTDSNYEMLMGYDLWKNNKVYSPAIKMQYATELFDDEISSIIDDHIASDNSDQPMFLLYTPPNPHAPIQYHYEFDDQCSALKDTSELIRYKYCNLIQELDNSIEHLVNKLKTTGMYDNSIIVFTSDNGGLMCWDVGSVNSCSGSVNLPLRGGKGTLFEGSIRVRSTISGGYISSELHDTTSHDYIHAIDLFVSLAKAANIDDSVIYGDDLKATGVIGVNFWDRLINPIDISAPQRTSPFIADLKLDETASYIEKAAVFWQGYKYIIQPEEVYDGWWQSPLQGVSDIPQDSKGIQTEPQPLPNKKLGPNSDLADGNPNDRNSINHDAHEDNPNEIGALPNDGDTEEIDTDSGQYITTLKMNEYLFRINEDPAETMNVRPDPANEQILQELRLFLGDLAGAPKFHAEQDATTKDEANPNKFGNIWYPFEENYHG